MVWPPINEIISVKCSGHAVGHPEETINEFACKSSARVMTLPET